MKARNYIVIALTSFAALSAQAHSNEQLLKAMSEVCLKEAQANAEKAVNDSIALSGAFGGNVSAQAITDLSRSKAGYIQLAVASCEADAIRKFQIKTPYPLN